jgi:hypothetical protein
VALLICLKYLGLPLRASFKLKAIWRDLEDLMARRLAPRKWMYLSKGGRVALIKSTLSNLPTYMLSLFPIMADVAKRIEKIQRDFLWGGLNDELKFHLVDWDTVCSPIPESGLGIRNVRKFNQALLGKWLWRYTHEDGAWWRSILVAKDGSSLDGWRSNDITESHGVGLWKYICMGWSKFKHHFRFDPWVALRLVFGRMLGVGRVLSKIHFLVCLVLPGSWKLPLRIIWNVPMVPFSGILSSPA